MTDRSYDVVVVGGGHAGTEAASVAARMGARTLLLTQRLDKVGELSCNPSIGGIGKSHLVREVDALDGLMARAADAACIHNKLLNRSKGPAVRGTRVQADRRLYRLSIQEQLAATENLDQLEGEADSLILGPSGEVAGVNTRCGSRIRARSVVVATGTFLNGVVHVGAKQSSAGRMGEAPSLSLAASMARLGLPIGRLKTGTPPRLARSSVDWDSLAPDWSDEARKPLSFMTGDVNATLVDCRITGTTVATHDFIRANLNQTALYSGAISGKGPRYCPSIEDKIVRFSDRDRHQIFLEPEGLPGTLDGDVVYPNGISTSLPARLQGDLLRTIPGLENAQITRPGYAIEYDFVQPTALSQALQLRALPGLFLAGQINGTTGYEEAAAQGIFAGINAARRAGGLGPFILDRASSYIGVMVEDLTTRGVTEPYRMFTSRSEYRLRLRCDNADLRLTPLGIELGCVAQDRRRRVEALSFEVDRILRQAADHSVTLAELSALGIPCKQDGTSKTIFDVVNRGLSRQTLSVVFPWILQFSSVAYEQVEIHGTYRGYMQSQDAEIRQFRGFEDMPAIGSADLKRPAGSRAGAHEVWPPASCEIRAAQ